MATDDLDPDNPFAPGKEPSLPVNPELGPPTAMEIGAILSRSWELFTQNPGVVIGAILIPAVISGAFSGADTVFTMMGEEAGGSQELTYSLISLVINIVSFVVQVFFTLGVTRIFLNLSRGAHAELGMLVGEGEKLLSGLGATILMALAVVIGLLLLVVPGVIVYLGLYVTLYALVDRDVGAIEAMQESWRLTDGHKMFLFLFSLVVFVGVLIFAVVTCGIGLLIVVPALALVQAVIYNNLLLLQD